MGWRSKMHRAGVGGRRGPSVYASFHTGYEGLFLGGLDIAIASLAPLKLNNGLKQICAAEVRPQRVSHIDFAIGDLPEQEIRHSHLPAGSDKQIGIRKTRGEQVALQVVLGYLRDYGKLGQ